MGGVRKKKASHIHDAYKSSVNRILTVVIQLKILTRNQALIKDCGKPTMPNYSYIVSEKKLTSLTYDWQ